MCNLYFICLIIIWLLGCPQMSWWICSFRNSPPESLTGALQCLVHYPYLWHLLLTMMSFLLDMNEVLCALVSKDLSLNFYISVNLLYIRDSITSASATNGGLFSYKQGLGSCKCWPLVLVCVSHYGLVQKKASSPNDMVSFTTIYEISRGIQIWYWNVNIWTG